MTRRTTALPELVWSPNHAGYGDDETARRDDFLSGCKEGKLESWTCKKTAALGDVHLFWFSKPVSELVGIGISDGEVEESLNEKHDWTDSKKVWFCGFKPLIALKEPLNLEAISNDRILARWWKGRPFQGRPKKIVTPSVAKRLAELILERNHKDRQLARLLGQFLQGKR